MEAAISSKTLFTNRHGVISQESLLYERCTYKANSWFRLIVRLVTPMFWITPWWWHPGAETCRSCILVSECILLSSWAGLCINYKNMHGMNNIKYNDVLSPHFLPARELCKMKVLWFETFVKPRLHCVQLDNDPLKINLSLLRICLIWALWCVRETAVLLRLFAFGTVTYVY
jgi:hypothetical protein